MFQAVLKNSRIKYGKKFLEFLKSPVQLLDKTRDFNMRTLMWIYLNTLPGDLRLHWLEERGRPAGVEVPAVWADLRLLRPHPPRAVPCPRSLPHSSEARQEPARDHHQVPGDHMM